MPADQSGYLREAQIDRDAARCRRATPRDALTGEPIRADTIHRHIQPDERADNQPTRAQHRDGWRADLTARPLRLHTTQVEEGGLGGHCFSADFARYLAKVKPSLLSASDAESRYWWLSEYGQERVERRFQARYGYDAGRLAYRAALAVASHYLDIVEVMTQTGRSAGWIANMCALADRYARSATSTSKAG